MKRRGFIRAIVAAPAIPTLVGQQPVAPVAPGRGGGRGAQEVPKIEVTSPDVVGEPVARFFTASQFAALRKLSGILVPPLKGNPGALDTDAPEFIDFLIGASPADRQKLYRTGLDYLNAQAKKQFGKSFADVDASQADAILKPLLVAVAWAYDPPSDPMKRFIFQAHRDIQTAARNSREWSVAGSAGGRRGGGGAGVYWNPIDPIYKG